jgi:hypothetical protein
MTKDGGLRPIFRTKLIKFHWQSIESPLTGKGTPDSNYCFEGYEGWIEFKASSTPRKVSSLKPEQVAWAERRARAGGRVFMAVRVRYGNHDLLYLVRARAFRQVYTSGLASLPPSSYQEWDGGPRSWDWGIIALILTSTPFEAKNLPPSP